MLYSFQLEGEDHTLFVYDIEASTRDEAYDKLECIYPDARILECYSKDELHEIEQARYERIALMQEDGWDYE